MSEVLSAALEEPEAAATELGTIMEREIVERPTLVGLD